MNPTIVELTVAVEWQARKRPEAIWLMTHPGVGPRTALAYLLIIYFWFARSYPKGEGGDGTTHSS